MAPALSTKNRRNNRRSVVAGMAAVGMLLAARPALAQTHDSAAAGAPQATNNYQRYADPTVRVGLLLFAGYGQANLTSVGAGVVPATLNRYQSLGFGPAAAAIDRLKPRSGTVGGDFALRFRGGLVGATVGYRLQTGDGPRLSASADRAGPAPLHDDISSALDWRTSVLSLGPTLNAGPSFILEPSIDIDFWKVTTSTMAQSSGVPTTSITERKGTSRGWGLRAVGFVSRSFGVGVEYHRVPMRNATPASAVAPWTSDATANQVFAAVYYRAGQ
jgi:hypothetical protein